MRHRSYLSDGCEVLTCTVDEHVMFSEATGWRNRQRLWFVSHKGENGPQGISNQGDLPQHYSAIRDRFTSQQESEGGADAEVDWLFEIPLVLVQTFIGYKHDEDSPAFEARGFEVQESTQKTWLQRILGR